MRTMTPKVGEHLPDLRRSPTPQEQVLWEAVRGRRLAGFKFRRQHPLESVVVDFYVPEVRLIVELDGNIHDNPDQMARDRRREAKLERRGYHVVRVRNEEVVVNLPAVLERLGRLMIELRAANALTPDPSPVSQERGAYVEAGSNQGA